MEREFTLLYVFAGIGLIFYLIELFLSRKFNITFFNLGIKVKKTSISLAGKKISIPRGSRMDMAEGKFYFGDDGKVYFLSQYFWFKMFRVETPFPFKSAGTFRYDETLEIVSKTPISSAFFMLFFFIAWILIAIDVQSYEMGLIGAFVFAYMIVFGYIAERKRFNVMIQELNTIIFPKEESL